MNIAVVGAGISGLSTAHFLKKSGADVVVFERNDFPGGTISSKIVEGYLVENGPNSTSETNLVIDELLEDLNILDEKVYADENSKNRFILRNGRLQALLPESVRSFRQGCGLPAANSDFSVNRLSDGRAVKSP